MMSRYCSPLPLSPAVARLALALGAIATACAQEPALDPEPPEKNTRPSATVPRPSFLESAGVKTNAPKHTQSEGQGLLNLGASLTERNDFEAAEIAFRQVMNSPHASETELKGALIGLAHMHRRKGELTKAVAIYEKFLKDYYGDPRTPDTLLALGRTLRDLGIYKQAVSKFYAVITSTLKPPPEGFEHYQVLAKTAQFEIAETHFIAGEFAEANKFYTKFRLLDIAPADRARAHFKAGYSLRLQGDLEGAVTSLKAFLSQWPEDENVPEARYLLAVSLRELKRPQEAFAATLELLRTEKARIAADPKRWARWQLRTGNQLANDFFENGDTLNAQAIYAALLDLSADNTWRVPIMYQLALCYERLAATEKARACYQQVLDAAGQTPPPELAELVRMAAWRIEHLQWRDRVGEQITKFFEAGADKHAVALPGAAPLKSSATP